MRLRSFGGVLLAASIGVQAAPVITMINLAGSAQALAPHVYLSGIASIQPGDGVCAKRIGEIQLGDAPAPGFSRVLRRGDIAAVLSTATLLDCRFQLAGAEQVFVTGHGHPADLARLRAEGGTALTAELEQRFGSAVIGAEPVNEPLASFEVSDTTALDLQVPDFAWPRARMRVDVLVRTPGHAVWSYPLWYKVRVVAAAWQLDEAMRPGSAIDRARRHLTSIDLAALTGTAVDAQFDWRGYVAKVPLPAGTIVTREALQRAPDVIAGESVRLLYRSQSIEVEATAFALQSGLVGDRVRVRNGRSNEVVVGYVGGPGLVTVTP